MKKASAKVDESVKQISDADLPAVVDEIDSAAEAKLATPEPVITEEPKIVSPVKVRPMTPVSTEDYSKKEAQRPKFDKIKGRIESKKEEAADKFKQGRYADANKLYKNAAEQLSESLDQFPLFKKEISQLEAGVFNNIAFCYGKDQQHKSEIEYTSMVVDRALYLDSTDVLVKAYLRRGLAYEHLEKFRSACNDLSRVRELQPYNKQAQTGLQRCLKYIEQDEGIKYEPTADDTALPYLEGITTAEAQLEN
jgi:tetratricopeptide (TPR) repeat protein